MFPAGGQSGWVAELNNWRRRSRTEQAAGCGLSGSHQTTGREAARQTNRKSSRGNSSHLKTLSKFSCSSSAVHHSSPLVTLLWTLAGGYLPKFLAVILHKAHFSLNETSADGPSEKCRFKLCQHCIAVHFRPRTHSQKSHLNSLHSRTHFTSWEEEKEE